MLTLSLALASKGLKSGISIAAFCEMAQEETAKPTTAAKILMFILSS
jgi:hypothetical protein